MQFVDIEVAAAIVVVLLEDFVYEHSEDVVIEALAHMYDWVD